MEEIIAPRMVQDSMIRVYKNAYTGEFCDKTRAAWGKITRSDNEATNHEWSDAGLRRDKAIFMDLWDEDTPLDEVALRKDITTEVISALMPKVNDYLKDVGIYQDVLCRADGVKVQKYDHTRGGGYYRFHSEQSAQSDKYLRRLLVYTVYLNDVPAGEGETEFLNQGFRYQPCKGDLVIFPAFFTHTHRGNPVYTTDKYIATGWILWTEPEDEGGINE